MATVQAWRLQPLATAWPELALAVGVLVVVAGFTLAPVGTLVVAATSVLVVWLVRRPFLIPVLLAVLMGNVKANYYMGFFTLFPEYLLLLLAGALGFAAWLGRRSWHLDERAVLLFGLWMFTGLLSVPFAVSVSKVLGRIVIMGFALLTFMTVVATVGTRARLFRVLAVWELVATLYALYGILQMVALMAGFDVTPHFLEGIANPDMYLGVGSPVRRRIGDVFRANSMFNDPNIFGGFLAASMVVMLALRLHHEAEGRRGRAAAELVALWVMGIALLLTQSRSSFLALLAGGFVVFRHRPQSFARLNLPLIAGVGIVAMVGVAMLIGIDPTLLVTRFAGVLDTNDTSNRQHLDVFMYGLDLVRRFPLTGVGLGNFGLFYGAEQDAWFSNMMSHCAPLSAFAESGIPGGLAFTAFWASLLLRMRRLEPAPGDAPGDTLRIALLASLFAVLTANVFYDYLMRTFIWVIVGLSLVTLRVVAAGRGTQARA